MSDLTSLLDLIDQAQGNKESKANALFNGVSIASAFAQRAITTDNANWGYYGVTRWWINAALATKANATIAMANGDNYISADRALAVSKDGSAFAPDKLAVFKVTLSAGITTDRLDYRDPHHINRFLYGRFVLAMADANQTLSYEQAMCESMELTGALTALRDVVVPLVPRAWAVYANVSGSFGVRVIGATGTGITIADGMRAIVECDGTDVVRLTADV
jgi:hypothetical protein